MHTNEVSRVNTSEPYRKQSPKERQSEQYQLLEEENKDLFDKVNNEEEIKYNSNTEPPFLPLQYFLNKQNEVEMANPQQEDTANKRKSWKKSARLLPRY